MTSEELSTALEAKRPEMIRIAAAKLRRHGLEYEAEDFVQEAMIEILRGLAEDRYTFDEGVGPIFQTTLVHRIYDRFAKERTAQRTTDEYTRIYQPDSQAHMQQRERLKVDVELALAKLDPLTGQIARLVWMEALTYRQIMRQLRVTDRTITAALNEARPVLCSELARYDHRQRPPSVPARERVSTSQPPYKKENDETDTASPDGGHGGEMTVSETLGAAA